MKSKTYTAAVIAAMMLTGSVIGGGAASAAKEEPKVNMDIKLLYNARQLPSDVQPEMVNGTTLVPLRVVSDKLGGKLTLTGKSISIVKEKSSLSLTIGSATATINGKPTNLPVPVKVVKGRTLVPLRVVGEGLGVVIEYDPDLRFVWIGNKNVPTLEEVVKGKFVDSAPFYKQYPELKSYLQNQIDSKHIAILTKEDLPFAIHNATFYRMDLAYLDNQQVLQVASTDKGDLLTPFYYLTTNKNMPFRYRSANNRFLKGDIRLNCYPIPSGRDWDTIGDAWEKFSSSEIDYVGMRLPLDTGVIIKNPTR
ncbi:copper amine oxidase N-terminal domain-containing protein (plasmid) [Paenibacillus rhizovicinus]|uniref:Copper amine oxidase N-terminal domain-containing protein n=1 Tax=Paenibacillus rhizovicinus TaxID=2704463 RepID=A0A6C0PA54_9BACL|nr:copper amine oxidase N-terminal domain-containing protein [Paenibacillus rhizovicinus]QHW35428.1 copper amine oxidase N-terminal domain-containing protein [Paenibacillus rhizovicinus]